jgi:hypothetical protein
MNKLIGLAFLATACALGGCGNGTDQATEAQATDSALDAGTTSADMSPTLEGSGDLSSAAGAGADTAAMDGGRAGDDGTPAPGEGEGGASDALSGSEDKSQ